MVILRNCIAGAMPTEIGVYVYIGLKGRTLIRKEGKIEEKKSGTSDE